MPLPLPKVQLKNVYAGYYLDLWNYLVSLVNALLAFLVPVGTPGAALVLDWYVNPLTGSNANGGTTPGTPLASAQEVVRRIGLQYLNGATTIHFLGAGVDGEPFTPQGLRGSGSLTVRGNRTPIDAVAGYTVATLANWTTDLEIGTFQLTAANLSNPNLTALGYVGKFVSLNSDPTVRIQILVDLGTGTFLGTWTQEGAGLVAPPVDGSAVTVYSINGWDAALVDVVRVGGPTVAFVDCLIDGTNIESGGVNSGVVFSCCAMGAGGSAVRVTSGLPYFEGGSATSGLVTKAAGGITALGLGMVGGSQGIQLGGAVFLDSVLAYGMSTLNFGAVDQTPGLGNAVLNGPVAVYDYATGIGTGTGVHVWSGSTVRANARLFTDSPVNAAEIGMQVDGYASIVWAPFAGPPDVTSVGVSPTREFVIGTIQKSAADLPFNAVVASLLTGDGSGNLAAIVTNSSAP